MFLSIPSRGDDNEPAAMATSNDSMAPGLTISSQKFGPKTTPSASSRRTTRTFVVDAVYSWMLDVPAIETRPEDSLTGTRVSELEEAAMTAPQTLKCQETAESEPSEMTDGHVAFLQTRCTAETPFAAKEGQPLCQGILRDFLNEFAISPGSGRKARGEFAGWWGKFPGRFWGEKLVSSDHLSSRWRFGAGGLRRRVPHWGRKAHGEGDAGSCQAA